MVCNVLSGWAPVLKGEQLWLNKAAPKAFAEEVTELLADLTILPKGGLDEFTALFKHEEYARLAEEYLRERCGSTTPLRDIVALHDALLLGVLVAPESCPRCATTTVDHGEHTKVPRKSRVCGQCNYEFSVGEPVVANPLGRFNPTLYRSMGRIVLLSALCFGESFRRKATLGGD